MEINFPNIQIEDVVKFHIYFHQLTYSFQTSKCQINKTPNTAGVNRLNILQHIRLLEATSEIFINFIKIVRKMVNQIRF